MGMLGVIQRKDAQRDDKFFINTRVEYKDISTQDSPGTIEAIVSVFNNKDFAGEVVMPGAFKNSLINKLPRFVWAHNWEMPLGKTLEAYELLPGDPRLPISLQALGGLYVKGQFNLNTSRGKDAYEDLKFGSIDEFSIGYRVIRAHRVTEEGDAVDASSPFDGFFSRGTRYLDEVELIEWSPVLAGMNDRTQLIGVKTDAPIVDLIDQAVNVLAVVLQEAKAYGERREKVGRTFSQANYDKLSSLADSLESNAAELRSLLATAKSSESEAPKQDTPAQTDEELLLTPVNRNKVIAEFEETRMKINALLVGV